MDRQPMVCGPLHYAAWQGQAEPVALLLEYNSSVNDASSTGDTPLHLAAQHGHVLVIEKLLGYHANPLIRNCEHKTPLDLACEFGRQKRYVLLLRNARCRQLLYESRQDTLDNERTTCLHLAARNGHTSVLRCLLAAGTDINRSTLRGTALHEAAMHGKLEAVRLLLQSGIDVNKPNSSEQTALDLVRTFSSSKAARDLKVLLREMLQALPARAIRDHYDPSDSECLILREGDMVTVLEQCESGRWKGIVFGPGHSSRAGYFPATAVQLLHRQVGGLQRNGTLRSSTIKKVAPPVVPDTSGGGCNSTTTTAATGRRHSSSSACTTPVHQLHSPPLYGSSDQPPPSPTAYDGADQKTFSPAEVFSEAQMAPLSRPQSHPGTPVGMPTTPLPPGLPPAGGGNRGVCYLGTAGSLDDTGVTGGGGNPGRDSPSGGSVESRHSSSSLDSGRGSSSSSSADSKVAHRLSTGSHGSSSSLTLTSSVGSHMSSLTPEVVVLSPLNVAGLLVNGVSDTEVLTTWLKNLHFEEYTHLFLQAGYDMPTISRMTPEDLTAIGITKPAHRRKLKSEISNLNISDGIPDYKPDNLLTWLKLLRLEQYYGSLCQQGYATVDRVADLTWEDLEDIGIQKLGHQKKLMLAIKKVRDLNSGSRQAMHYGDARHSSVDMGQLLAARPGSHVPVPMGHPYQAVPSVNQPPCEIAPPHANAVPPLRSDTDPSTPQLRTFRQQSPPRMGGNFYRAGSGDSLILQQQHFSGPAFHQPPMQGSDLYQHDFVSMQVRSPNRGRSLESLEDGGPAYQSHSSAPYQPQYQGYHHNPPPYHAPQSDWYHMVSSWRQHGYDTDSEVVRQVSHGYDYGYEPDGTATLHRPRGLVKPRPVAKVAARALLDSPDLDYDPKDLDPKLSSDWPDTGGGAKRSPAPTPPKRTNSIRRQQEANIAETAFATCVQSLTSRFTMATTRDEPPLPPPPPPATSANSVVDEAPQAPLPPPPAMSTPNSASSSDGELSPSGTLLRRKDSNGSSVSSESLPFACENVGTIKQRPGESVPPPLPQHGTALAAGGSPGADDDGLDKPPCRTSPPTTTAADVRSPPEEVPVRDVPRSSPPSSRDKATAQKPTVPPRPVDKLSLTAGGRLMAPAPSSSSSGDVIHDIEHMLASLTDQLDAMLESELNP
ncbi:caskin-1 [Rhipicephalus sanguineus]|uniref:caskin-1 n=1 Tax=Rhipicephalus sanguineus TaxID=34632 RepID=UPI0020C219F6|nr:caskin-1 [Rhipicephalus sanguineus]